MKILKIFLCSVLFWVQYSLWLGKNGVLDYIKIYHKVTIQKKKNEHLDTRNNQLILEIEKFNNYTKNNKKDI